MKPEENALYSQANSRQVSQVANYGHGRYQRKNTRPPALSLLSKVFSEFRRVHRLLWSTKFPQFGIDHSALDLPGSTLSQLNHCRERLELRFTSLKNTAHVNTTPKLMHIAIQQIPIYSSAG
ncbi:hypothetical protein RRG08_003038 [Elysia crispata]|uniref:Uncharacterized protein n=1 Tax=Elysia crispata TaxID=231223 RepID=A0AAE1B836_9GAST|nr:hypothetical protein RRG08_003038 [Elysia crispata]